MSAGRDLGTYHVIVEFANGDGFIYEWGTNGRFTHGRHSCHPLKALYMPPPWEDEAALIRTIIYAFTEGNYSCDCNRYMFLADAKQSESEFDGDCGDSLKLLRLTLIRPDNSRAEIWAEGK